MIPVVTSSPAVEPVTVETQKLHSRIDYDGDDALLTALLRAARERAEGHLARKLITQTVRWLPASLSGVIKLPYPNVQSVTVRYYDDAGTIQTATENTVYRVLNLRDPANDCLLEPIENQIWPTPDDRLQPWLIDFVCGYGDNAENVPDEIKLGMMLLVGQWYANRDVAVTGTIVSDLPFTVNALWASHKWRPVT
jgi:uncharacterized phiE125 gp8 family phage protein